MPFILRKIVQRRWYNDEPWLAEGAFKSSALMDLRVDDNKLSVWHIEDDKSNLMRVITALAATGDKIQNFDYALLDKKALSELNVRFEYTKGGTPDEQVNNRWHLDLIELSALKLFNLAQAIFISAERDRIPEKQVRQLIVNGVVSGQIDKEKLVEKMRKVVEKM